MQNSNDWFVTLKEKVHPGKILQHMAEEEQVYFCHMVAELLLQPLELWGSFIYSLN